MDAVVLFSQFTGNGHEFHTHKGKPFGFKSADDIADETALNAVRLDHNESAFQSFSPNNTFLEFQ